MIVVAKTAKAHRILARHFMKKRVEKRYLALVEGVVEQDEGAIDAPIGRHAELKHWSVKEDGKLSQSRFWVRERYDDTTLIELEPVTGRTNQLRIHCELIGHPIVGDVRRGGREFDRLCLHAWRLAFPHPTTREIISPTAHCHPGDRTYLDRKINDRHEHQHLDDDHHDKRPKLLARPRAHWQKGYQQTDHRCRNAENDRDDAVSRRRACQLVKFTGPSV